MSNILVVVDMQKKFIKECGAENIVPKAVEKIEERKIEGYEILFTCDKFGGEFEDRIRAAAYGSKIYNKHSYGCEELILDLKKKSPETVEFIGICTDICVITNVLATMSFLPFAKISVAADCCASEREGHLAALRVLKACKVEVI